MGLFSRIVNTFKRSPKVDWDELEELLVTSDIGIRLAMEIVDDLRDKGRKIDADDVIAECRKVVMERLPDSTKPLPLPTSDGPRVILVVGVNGTGKTTSCAKLGHYLQSKGHSVVLAAADTFRAAAVEQLETWAQRLNLPMVKGAPNADPSSVCFDAYQSAKARGADYLICDTAGRLHNRNNLMAELSKIRRTLGKTDNTSPHEVILVVDATTGGNAVQQAKEFHKATELTGLIVTKLDGSGKGGCVVAIQNELDIPTRFIGTGEQAKDFAPFDASQYVEELM
ncbi:signal recognition particle-docking protein FtsY [Sulfuriroseicoccus oceanibius]|uniref:Signal recognition particle receptor FtsY n=1 Tax=Sulfuriroseicoccus oceanibius TaxID=2707525 RepID=A0A6B3L271_9BACT|nr:signal recognition particle-docking protein FtsY [Sulfuriroseicoccus oceanibius]QQL43803.1 signal recognition particle-docking protein FtsY [Sulfuriroseicoccus oceanibius]